MKTLSEVISWVFMPLLMPIYALALVMFTPSNQDYFFNVDCLYLLPFEAKSALLYMFGIFCVIAPGISFLMLKRRNVISSIEMETQKERSIPIIIMLVYCLVLFILFIAKANHSLIPKFVYSLPLSGVGVTLVFFFLNRWKKVSIHSGAAGILTGFVLAYILLHVEYELWMFTATILVSGVVMSARLYLEKHTLFEILLGWSVGTLVTFLVNFYY